MAAQTKNKSKSKPAHRAKTTKTKSSNVISWSAKKSPFSFSRKQLTIFALAIGIIGSYIVYRTFAATNFLVTLEAETMLLSPNETGAAVIGDSSASEGKALQFKSKVLATGSTSLVGKPASNKLTVRAKGTQCQGAPQMEIKVDGAQPMTFSVSSSWADYTYTPTIAAGSSPQISVQFLNPTTEYRGKGGKIRCSSDLAVDKISLYEVTPDSIVANITMPSTASATVAGPLAVEAKPVSSNGVSKVEFFVGGTAANGYRDGTLTTENAAPYCLVGDGGKSYCDSWNSSTAPVANGTYTITAYAYDGSGTRSAPQTVNIIVNNPTATDPTPTTGTINPSGQAMPTTDLPGWKLKYTDDFPTAVPLGSFPAAVSDKWGAYPYPWRDTKGQNSSDPTVGGWYNPGKTVSIANGMMDIWMHTENLDGAMKRLVAAPLPKVQGPASSPYAGQTYGRYAVRFRVDSSRTTNNFSGYKVAWLLWPDSNKWPEDSEIDFPEGDLRSLIEGYLHKQGATCGQAGSLCGADQYYAKSGKSFGDWHTTVIEWGPNRGAFYFDGALMTDASGGKSEWFDRIPFNPMHWVLQSETELGSNVPAENTQGHIQIDWVAAWSKI